MVLSNKFTFAETERVMADVLSKSQISEFYRKTYFPFVYPQCTADILPDAITSNASSNWTSKGSSCCIYQRINMSKNYSNRRLMINVV